MKKITNAALYFLCASVGAFLLIASIGGLFSSFGIGTELVFLSLGFATFCLFSYATAQTIKR